jgi:hypothetical protein
MQPLLARGQQTLGFIRISRDQHLAAIAKQREEEVVEELVISSGDEEDVLPARNGRQRNVSARATKRHQVKIFSLFSDLTSEPQQPQKQTEAGERGPYSKWTPFHKMFAVNKWLRGGYKGSKGYSSVVESLQLNFGEQFAKLSLQTLKNWVVAAKVDDAAGAAPRGPKRQLPDDVFQAIKGYILRTLETGAQVGRCMAHRACLHRMRRSSHSAQHCTTLRACTVHALHAPRTACMQRRYIQRTASPVRCLTCEHRAHAAQVA